MHTPVSHFDEAGDMPSLAAHPDWSVVPRTPTPALPVTTPEPGAPAEQLLHAMQ